MITHTKVSVTKEMFAKRNEHNSRIAKLDGAKAKKLITAIKNRAQGSDSFKDAKMILDDQYPANLRSNDTDGKTAIKMLQRAIIHSVRSPEEAKEWETQIDTIEKQ